MRIYVASSWRNEAKQQATVLALREAGHEVYDFRHPAPGNEGFGGPLGTGAGRRRSLNVRVGSRSVVVAGQ
jgi:hypothetical protein